MWKVYAGLVSSDHVRSGKPGSCNEVVEIIIMDKLDSKERKKWLLSLQVGDKVKRLLGGVVPSVIEVTKITDNLIVCGPWHFLMAFGTEVDSAMGEYNGLPNEDNVIGTISYIVPE
jgi:hypothetical protein